MSRLVRGGSTNAMPAVSVVVPAYNAAAFIEATVRSVLIQSWSDFEIIVVDDKSTDDTLAIVERIAAGDPRVRVLALPVNHGAPAAPRNFGVKVARGEWLAFLDADDLWHPRKLETQMAALAKSHADMCSTRMRDFITEEDIRTESLPAEPRISRVTFTQQLVKYRTPTSSIVIRTELLRRLPFNEDISYKAREDTDCFIRVHEYMPFSVKVMHTLVYYRQQANQISGNKLTMVRRHFAMLRKYRSRAGRGLGAMAYVYTTTHFLGAIYLRWMRGIL